MPFAKARSSSGPARGQKSTDSARAGTGKIYIRAPTGAADPKRKIPSFFSFQPQDIRVGGPLIAAPQKSCQRFISAGTGNGPATPHRQLFFSGGPPPTGIGFQWISG